MVGSLVAEMAEQTVSKLAALKVESTVFQMAVLKAAKLVDAKAADLAVE